MSLLPIHPSARRWPHTIFLVWHDLVPAKKLVWFDTTVSEFDAQLARLTKAGAKPVSLGSVERWLTTGTNPPPPGAVVLCFDDNTEGIFRYAFPRLKKRGWPFAVSVHTKYVGVTTGKAHCTWEMLREMRQGGATVVNQTHTHPPDLRTLPDEDLADEFTFSRRLLSLNFRQHVPYLTYPSGKWDERLARAVEKADFKLALTEDYGYAENSPHRLGIHRYSTHKRFDEGVRAIGTHPPAPSLGLIPASRGRGKGSASLFLPPFAPTKSEIRREGVRGSAEGRAGEGC